MVSLLFWFTIAFPRRYRGAGSAASMLGSVAGFSRADRAPGPWDAHPHAAPLHTPSRCPAGCGVLRHLELRLSSPPAPHPRRSLPRQGKSPPSQQAPGPPLPREERGGEYLARTSRAAEGAQPAAAPQPLLQPREPRGKCPARMQNGLPEPAGPRPTALLPRHLGPPSPLGFAFVPPLEARLSQGEGEGEGRREYFRGPLGAPESGESPGWRAFLPSRGAARGAGKRTSTAETSGLGLDRWSAGARRRRRPGGATREGSRRATKWLGLDCCTFFLFVTFLGTKKKAQPFTPLHLHLSGPEARLQRLGATQTTAPHPTTGWVGLVLLLGPRFGLQPEHYQNNVNCTPLYRYLSRL